MTHDDCFRLTAYFGERARTPDRLVADALLGLYGRRGLATSVLLRGTEGYGSRHHLRSDSSLTLSEDLPAVAVAVDTRDQIMSVVDEAARLSGAGLLTLEQTRLHTGGTERHARTDLPHAATELTVYVGRRERVGRTSAFAAVCDLLHRPGVAAATAFLGVDGTRDGRRERARFLGRNADVPMMVIAVGASSVIADTLPELAGMLRVPLITAERIQVCKNGREVPGRPHELPGTEEHGKALWRKLTIYTSEAHLHDGRPIHRVMTRRLRRAGAAGVTTLRGCWGFCGTELPRGDRTWQLGRRVPAVTVVIDRPDRIAAWFDIVDEVTAGHALVTSEEVTAMRGGAGQGTDLD